MPLQRNPLLYCQMKNKMLNCFDSELLREFICFLGAGNVSKKPGGAKDVSYSVSSGRVVLCDQKTER